MPNVMVALPNIGGALCSQPSALLPHPIESEYQIVWVRGNVDVGPNTLLPYRKVIDH